MTAWPDLQSPDLSPAHVCVWAVNISKNEIFSMCSTITAASLNQILFEDFMHICLNRRKKHDFTIKNEQEALNLTNKQQKSQSF